LPIERAGWRKTALVQEKKMETAIEEESEAK
jgi:hypothetical protein